MIADKVKIYIDAGHGIHTAGKRSPDGLLREGVWNRKAARLLVARLEDSAIPVTWINDYDTDDPLWYRCRKINELASEWPYGYQNCLALSVHCNAHLDNRWTDAHGWEVFTYTYASPLSTEAAVLMSSEALSAGLTVRRTYPDRYYKTANYAMVRDTICPAILVENAFMTNRADCEMLLSDEGTEKLVDVMYRGLKDYCQLYGR